MASPAGRSLAVLLNPTAGSLRAGRERARLRAALDASGARFELLATERPRHASALAREVAEDFDAVIAAGGDGTLQEVATGLFGLEDDEGRPRAALGVIPLGTGNDFAELIRMPRRPEAAVRALLTARPVRVDGGAVRWREGADRRWHEGVFLNAVGVGLDALAAALAGGFKRFRGKSAYLAGILRALREWPRPEVAIERLSTDGAAEPLHRGRLFLAAVGNGRAVGGGFRLTPEALLTDGLLDLCFVEDVRHRRLPVLIPQVIRGRHLGASEVRSERLPGLRLCAAEHGLPVHLDGEVLTRAASEVEVRIAPGAFCVLCPDPSVPALGKARAERPRPMQLSA